MRWRKRDVWKAGIAVAGMLLLLVLMVWVPVSAAGVHERVLGLATPVMVQATPTEDATVTALNKEKLAQEVQQLKNQNVPDPLGWLRTNASILLSTLVVVLGGLFGLWRWRVDRRDAQDKELEDRQAERKKQVEEQFQSAVTGLGDEKEGAKISAAIRLRTFLRPGYEQYYTQIFDLAVANLRLPRTPPPPDDPDGIPHSPADPNTPQPLTPLSQVLIAVFTEAFPLVRDEWIKKRKGEPFDPRYFDARYIQLDRAFLWQADLEQVWMPWASLRATDLSEARLSGAALWWAKLCEANLGKAKLYGADLGGANLKGADLGEADLRGATLTGEILDARSLEGTDLRGVKGLTKEQLKACYAKGARIDKDSTTSSSQSPVSPPPPSQSTDAQAPSVPSAPVSTPTSGTDGSSTTSSKLGSES